MEKPTNILVPIDFSAASRNAFRQALHLGRDQSRFILLHVIPPTTEKGGKRSTVIASARRSLASFVRNEHARRVRSFRCDVRAGTPFQEILAAAQDNNVEIIVLGVDNLGPFGGLAVGHTADRVSRYAKCPVLLVREGSTPGTDSSSVGY
jgi:nucleotide-binding universal stress UspA family protein